MIPITYTTGDATAPAGTGNKIICHICNDLGGWGAGFVLAISNRWPAPEADYRKWYRGRTYNDFALGAVQVTEVEPGVRVANMIAQSGLRTVGGIPPIPYEALEAALFAVSAEATRSSASVHMPRIGCGLAGGTWDHVEPIILRTLSMNNVPVFVYDFGPPSDKEAAERISRHGGGQPQH